MISTMPYSCRIRQAWQHQDVYDRMMAWVDDNAGYGIDIRNGAYGISYINGRTYYAEVRFAKQEDVTLFKLLFPEIT